MSAMTVGYPPITDQGAVADWLDYERDNARANANYHGVEGRPECTSCGRLSETKLAHVQHLAKCRPES